MRYSLLIFFLCLSNYGFCCTCGPYRSVNDEFNKSEVVVIGKIIDYQSIVEIDSSEYKRLIEKGVHETQAKRFTSGGFNQYTLVLLEPSYKGAFKSDTLHIRTGLTSGACGYSFQVGKDYVIYGYNKTQEVKIPISQFEYFWTDNCTRTKLFSEVERRSLWKIVRRTNKKKQ